MDADQPGLRHRADELLWPLVETFVAANDVAGLAVGIVHEGDVVMRGFGVRDLGTRWPVTPETMFHLASVSKPFVATAVVSVATAREGAPAQLDLDAPIVQWVPELTLADGRQAEVTARGLLSHTSGLPDVSDYGWHEPQLGDDALSEFARSLSGWRLQTDPGTTFAYSNAGFELLGLLLSRVTGTTFEDAVRHEVLAPVGMRDSTFLRAEVPVALASSPHVAMPLQVPEGAYPYTRRHAPSSTLHSNVVEMCRWMTALVETESSAGSASLDPRLLELMWTPVLPVDEPPWDEGSGLGWGVGRYRGHRVLGHSGADPGFGSRFAVLPDRRTGVVVLANSNTVPTSSLCAAALDVVLNDPVPIGKALGRPTESGEALRSLEAHQRPVVGPVAETLAASGPDAAAATYHRLAAAQPAAYDLDDEGFADAVWGAIELHRTDLVWPLLRLWTDLRPDSSTAWTMTGWAYQVDGEPELARSLLLRALELDPGNGDAQLIMGNLPGVGPLRTVTVPGSVEAAGQSGFDHSP